MSEAGFVVLSATGAVDGGAALIASLRLTLSTISCADGSRLVLRVFLEVEGALRPTLTTHHERLVGSLKARGGWGRLDVPEGVKVFEA